MKKPVEKTIVTKLKKLSAIAEGLQSGENYPITRLTTLKSLCADQKAAAKFASSLATLAQSQATTRARPQHLKLTAWREQKELIARTVALLESYVKTPTKAKQGRLSEALAEVRGVNNEYKPSRWGPVRIIQNRYALIVENSLRCVLAWTAEETGFWAYHAARDYAEKYNPHYGTGLIPASAPLVQEIVKFWCEYYGVSELDRA